MNYKMLPDPQWVKWMGGRLFGEQENEEFRKEVSTVVMELIN